jgi:TonB-dependent receptor
MKTFSKAPRQRRLISLAVAGACAAISIAQAQESSSPAGDASTTPSVVVTGIRASMQSTLNMKRNSDGIVDGIVAEDMGKFPIPTWLNRCSGFPACRSTAATARARSHRAWRGPDFNLVLLNGRQMPTTDLGDLSGRSFDFSNLASESISQLQVYKSGRADNPSGGIGATINVVTARPFDNPGLHASVGVKALKDTSNDHVPELYKGKSVTPEVSGIYPTPAPTAAWRVAERQLPVARFRRQPRRPVQRLPGPVPGFGRDRWPDPAAARPARRGRTSPTVRRRTRCTRFRRIRLQQLGHPASAHQRPADLQFRPVKELTTTVDYTYSEQKIQTKRSE